MRPECLVVVTGTGTEVGKTWVAGRLLAELRGRGATVAARKPAQSFDVDADGTPLGGPTDAAVLARASGESPDAVCPPWRSYRRAMAPPMAADALGLPGFSVADLVNELRWPSGVRVGVVELAGGVRSPQASDGDATHLIDAVVPDLVLLVADAGLGTLNGVRLSAAALRAGSGSAGGSGARGAAGATGATVPMAVVLDRFDPAVELHRRNRAWLAGRDGYRVVVVPGEEAALADLVLAVPAPP